MKRTYITLLFTALIVSAFATPPAGVGLKTAFKCQKWHNVVNDVAKAAHKNGWNAQQVEDVLKVELGKVLTNNAYLTIRQPTAPIAQLKCVEATGINNIAAALVPFVLGSYTHFSTSPYDVLSIDGNSATVRTRGSLVISNANESLNGDPETRCTGVNPLGKISSLTSVNFRRDAAGSTNYNPFMGTFEDAVAATDAFCQ